MSQKKHSTNKKIAPVLSMKKHGDFLVARSQAKQIVLGMDEFDLVTFDFDGVRAVSPSFADQIFRVFANYHPHIKLTEVNTVPDVQKMINRARSHTN